jgi:hypothetical protein
LRAVQSSDAYGNVARSGANVTLFPPSNATELPQMIAPVKALLLSSMHEPVGASIVPVTDERVPNVTSPSTT